MSAMPQIGLMLSDEMPPAQILDMAMFAEGAGFDEIWVCEDYFLGAGVATAASLLARTRLRVGVGVFPATGRHPALLALELATLADMFPGRLTAGIGAGIPEWNATMGMHPRSPLRAVSAALKAVRTLLDGNTLDESAELWTAREIRLTHPPAIPPRLYVGATGPRMLALSATHADGTVLSVLSGTRYVGWASEQLDQAGGARPHRLVVYALCAIDDDVEAARAMLRPALAIYAVPNPRNPLSELQGFADEAAELATLPAAEVPGRIPDRWLDELVIAGSLDHCLGRIQALGDAGADTVVLCFPGGAVARDMVRTAGRALAERESSDRTIFGQVDRGAH